MKILHKGSKVTFIFFSDEPDVRIRRDSTLKGVITVDEEDHIVIETKDFNEGRDAIYNDMRFWIDSEDIENHKVRLVREIPYYKKCLDLTKELPKKEVRTYRSYNEMDKAHQNDVNAFHVAFLFGNVSDEELLKTLHDKLGAESLEDVCGGIVGEILLIKDAPDYEAMWKNHDAERTLFNQNFDNFVSSIRHIMDNHEFGYTEDPTDVLCELGKSYIDLETDEEFRKAWNKAKEECLASYAECN